MNRNLESQSFNGTMDPGHIAHTPKITTSATPNASQPAWAQVSSARGHRDAPKFDHRFLSVVVTPHAESHSGMVIPDTIAPRCSPGASPG
jgi:hypothetical protein